MSMMDDPCPCHGMPESFCPIIKAKREEALQLQKEHAFRSKLDTLRRAIENMHKEIAELQNKCAHPEKYLKKVNKANTGNWCPQDDSYWTEFDCSLCGKH